MADITDPTAIGFSNEKIRTAAARMAYLYTVSKPIIAEWWARGGSSFIANDAADTLIDGSANDSRPVINGADVNNVITRLIEFIADLEANGSAKLNTILAMTNQNLSGE